MLENPELFQALGISWTVAKCFAAAAVFLFLVSALLFTVLFKHTRGKVRRLSPEEAGRVARYAAIPSSEPRLIDGKGVGAEAELSYNIDTLRKAAGRGDWLTFWGFPGCFACFFGSFWCCFMAIAALTHSGFVAIVISVTLGLMLALSSVFMPWAAIYTDIDKDPDEHVETPDQP
jgi:hypothetical protein